MATVVNQCFSGYENLICIILSNFPGNIIIGILAHELCSN